MAGHEIIEIAVGSAVFETWLNRPALAAIEFNVGNVVLQPVFGLDVDNAGRAQSELGWQDAGQQADAVRKARAQYLAEASDSLRQLDTINTILKIRMIAAHVKLAE